MTSYITIFVRPKLNPIAFLYNRIVLKVETFMQQGKKLDNMAWLWSTLHQS